MTRYLVGRLSVFIIAVFLLTVFSFSLNYLFPGPVFVPSRTIIH